MTLGSEGGARAAHTVRSLMAAGAIADAMLVCLGVARYPAAIATASDGAWGLIGPLAMLAIYAAIGWLAALSAGLAFGGAAGALFLVEMLVGYLAPLSEGQNAILGAVMYGGFATLLLAAGVWGGWRTRRLGGGLRASLWAALLGSLVWLAGLWLTTHLFWGTPQEARQFVADQVIADFQRSGQADLRAFALQDNLGGSFFHLLLGPLVAALLGTLGGLAGAGLARVGFRRQSRPA